MRLPVPAGLLMVAPLPPSGSSTVRLSLILPTYNESQNIEEMVRRLTAALDSILPDQYEVVIVDDDSPDRTWERALALTSSYPQLRVMCRTGERGLSTAVIRGWQAARGEVLAVIDADLQHPPELVCELWKEMVGGADMAVGSRNVEGGGVSDWSLLRRIISRGAQLLGLITLPGVVGRVSDPMSGCFMVKRSSIQGIELSPLGYKILIEVIARSKVQRIREVPYVFRERTLGESKVSTRVYLDYLRHLLRLRVAGFPVKRFFRFGVVGSSGVLVDMSMLYLLSDPSMLGWGLTRSKLIGAELAIINNFLWNDHWTFGDVAKRQKGHQQKLRRFLKFQSICFSGICLNAILLNVQFNMLDMNRYVANAVAIAAVMGWNFWLNMKLSWRVTAP